MLACLTLSLSKALGGVLGQQPRSPESNSTEMHAYSDETKQSKLDRGMGAAPPKQQRIIASRAYEPPKSPRPVSSDGLVVAKPTALLSIQYHTSPLLVYSYWSHYQ